ncbi:hypothetical protein FFLO_02493 [Filobasidium floriforme]|uniref:peptide-methionine (S)-S-oxide reductase n=1 Tax=Filobasidium floriforme TaxID=5210 RepID=A0A8K0NRS3_9TREE|nr:hypothetical protein FFLO_02493 [Filobasidium floriforme]
MPRYLTTAFLIIAILLAFQNQSISPIQDYMLRLKNFLAPFTTSAASTMVHSKPAPAPTVQTAIKEKESLTAGEGVETAVFANGCFWGTEHLFKVYYGDLPKFSAVSGYTGGHATNPTYREVCSGNTGHAESVKVTWQTGSVGYGELVEFFFRTHDPTTVDRQGPDRGSQYRSALFYTTPEQKEIAEKVTAEVQEKHLKGRTIVTQLAPLGKWHDAEGYHQNYLFDNPSGYQCPTHRMYW